jgi:hypothetical protein
MSSPSIAPRKAALAGAIPMILIRLSNAKRADVEPLLRRQWRTLASKVAIREFDISQQKS